MIPLLPGFWGYVMNGPLLPQFYTDYYSQESVIKKLTEDLQRGIEYNGLVTTTVNEILNTLNLADVTELAALVLRINALELAITTGGPANAAVTQELAAHLTLITALQTSVNTFTASQAAQDTAIAGVAARTTTVEASVTGLQTTAGTANTTVTALSGKVTTLNTSVDTLSTTVAAVQVDVNQAKVDASTALTDVGTFNGRVTTLETTSSGLTTSVNSAVAAANSASSTVATYDTRLTTAETSASNNTTSIGTLNTEVATLSGNVSTLTTNVSNNSATVGTVAGKVTALETSQAAQDTSINALQLRTTAVEGAITPLQSSVVNATNSATAANTAAAAASTAASAAQSTANNAASTSASNATNITNLQNTDAATATTLTGLRTDVNNHYVITQDNASKIASLQSSSSSGVFNATRGYGVLANNVDNNTPVYIPLQLGFDINNQAYSFKVTTRVNPVVVPGAIHYITDSDGSNGMLYYYTERIGHMDQLAVDGHTWTFSTPLTGTLVPILDEKPRFSTVNNGIQVWFTTATQKNGTGFTALNNMKLNAYMLVPSYFTDTTLNLFTPPAGKTIDNQKIDKVTLERMRALGVYPGSGNLINSGGSADFDITPLFLPLVVKNTSGQGLKLRLLATSAWSQLVSQYDFTSPTTFEAYLLLEGVEYLA